MKVTKEKHSKGKKSMSISCSLSTFLSATRAIVAKAQAHKGHWPKGSIMKFMNSRHGRLAVAFALASTLALIAACGGGGSGGGTTPPPPPPDPVDAVITLGATTPANGATDVKVGDPLTVAWSVDKGVYDTSSLKLTCDGSAVAGTWDHGKTGGTFTQAAALPRGATCVGEAPVSAKGENGGKSANEKLTFSFQTEAPVVKLSYDNVPVAVRFHNLGLVDASGKFVQATNNSKRAANLGEGKFRVDGVYIAEEPLVGSCLYPALMRMRDDFKWYPTAYDPVANAFADYYGPLPAGYEYANDTTGGLSVVGAKWHQRQRYYGTPDKKDWGVPPFDYMHTWTSDGKGGLYYASSADGRELHNLLADGKDIVTYPAQTDNGSFMVMNTITCH